MPYREEAKARREKELRCISNATSKLLAAITEPRIDDKSEQIGQAIANIIAAVEARSRNELEDIRQYLLHQPQGLPGIGQHMKPFAMVRHLVRALRIERERYEDVRAQLEQLYDDKREQDEEQTS